jgi:hypothetical protein
MPNSNIASLVSIKLSFTTKIRKPRANHLNIKITIVSLIPKHLRRMKWLLLFWDEQEFEVPQSTSTLKNGFFAPKHYCTPRAHGRKTFFSTLNLAILQMLRNEYVRFGRHVEI